VTWYYCLRWSSLNSIYKTSREKLYRLIVQFALLSIFQFVSHPNCQHQIALLYYGEAIFLQEWGTLKQILYLLLTLPMLPFLCFTYIVYPEAKVGQSVKGTSCRNRPTSRPRVWALQKHPTCKFLMSPQILSSVFSAGICLWRFEACVYRLSLYSVSRWYGRVGLTWRSYHYWILDFKGDSVAGALPGWSGYANDPLSGIFFQIDREKPGFRGKRPPFQNPGWMPQYAFAWIHQHSPAVLFFHIKRYGFQCCVVTPTRFYSSCATASLCKDSHITKINCCAG
jgi:hypothetical protein